MPHVPGLKAPREKPSDIQNARYFHLSQFLYKMTTVNGRHQYSREGLERLLKGARVLTGITKEGESHVRVERLQRLAKSLGVHDPIQQKKSGANVLPDVFYDDQDIWDYIAEGGSP